MNCTLHSQRFKRTGGCTGGVQSAAASGSTDRSGRNLCKERRSEITFLILFICHVKETLCVKCKSACTELLTY